MVQAEQSVIGCLMIAPDLLDRARAVLSSTRGPEWTDLWCTGCHASGIAG